MGEFLGRDDEVMVYVPKISHRRAVSDDMILQHVIVSEALVVVRVGVDKKRDEFEVATRNASASFALMKSGVAKEPETWRVHYLTHMFFGA